MPLTDQIHELERAADDLERLSHELGMLDCETSAARALRLSQERREKAEQLRGAPCS